MDVTVTWRPHANRDAHLSNALFDQRKDTMSNARLISMLTLCLGALGTIACDGDNQDTQEGGSTTNSMSGRGGSTGRGAPSKMAIAGTLEGQSVGIMSSLGISGASLSEHVFAIFANREFLFIEGCSFEDTFSSPAVLLKMPAGAPQATTWLCDVSNEMVTPTMGTHSWLTTLTTLRTLGSCPGKPVAGMVSYCDILWSPGCDACQFNGTINEVSFMASTTNLCQSAGGTPPGANAGGIQDGGVFMWDSTDTLSSGVLRMPASGPDPGALYCIGSVSLDGTTGQVVLGDLSRLGACAEAPSIDGTLTVSMED